MVNLRLSKAIYIGWHCIQSVGSCSTATGIGSAGNHATTAGLRPATLSELVGNRIQLNRLLGLSNLYYIDPEDQEILQELREVRLALIGAIEQCPEDQLESIWASDLGDRYWALVRSGIQKEPMTPVEEQKKHAATQKLNSTGGGGFGTPGAINAVLVAMTLFEPGTM